MAIGTSLSAPGLARLVQILAISGSLQANSSNRALVEAARDIAPDDVTVVVFESVGAVPHFNPDLDRAGPPEDVVRLRALIAQADGVLIASPEYAFGVPGALKNALDWLVGSGELYGKRVVLLSAAPSEQRGVNAPVDLERTLHAQGARVLASSTVVVRPGQAIDMPADTAIRARLEVVFDAFLGD